MANAVKITEDRGVVLTDAQKEEARDGVQWLKDWYQAKHDAGNFPDGEKAYQEAMKRLDNAQVIATDNISQSILKGLEEGTLHFNEAALRSFGYPQVSKEEATKLCLEKLRPSLEKQEKNDNRMAASAHKFLEEPVVFLDVNRIKENEGDIRCASISSLVTHEFTHISQLSKSENIVKQNLFTLNDNVSEKKSYDAELEKYARIMQLRKDLGLKPNQTLTVEEVQKIRESCEQTRQQFENGELKEVPHNIDYHIFDRYKDEEIVKALNLTAENRSSERQDLSNALRNDALLAAVEITVYEKLNTKENNATTTENSSTNTVPQNIDVLAVQRAKGRDLG